MSLIVTGASRGIGAAIAKLAGARGFSVAVNYSSDRDGAEAVVKAIGAGARSIQADVSDEEDVFRLFEQTEREFGPVDMLVNNAGVTGGFSRLEDLKTEALIATMNVNVIGTILCAREAVRRMSRRGGGKGSAIVNISSLVARTGGPGDWVHYAASKGAVDSFTLGLAREVAGEGIRVNAVAPGLIETDLHAANGQPNRLKRLAPSIPMQRAGTAEEVAEAVLWLLSAEASYVTGAILEVGGGR